MKRKTMILAVLAFVLVLGMGIAPGWAYFTARSTANGGLPVYTEPTTDVHEWYKEGVKHVAITNSPEAKTSVYVRARVYTSLDVEVSGTNWPETPTDGWYVYDQILAPGDTTDELNVSITFPKVQSEEQPDGAVYGDNYNVIVVYESTPVQYDSAGQPFADWSYILDSFTEESGD